MLSFEKRSTLLRTIAEINDLYYDGENDSFEINKKLVSLMDQTEYEKFCDKISSLSTSQKFFKKEFFEPQNQENHEYALNDSEIFQSYNFEDLLNTMAELIED